MKLKTAMRAAALAAFLSGCNTFTLTQTNAFVDDDGNVLTVRYGRLEKERSTTVINPMTGKNIDMKSRLAVSLTLPKPNGSEVMAYQCMNLLPSGTMYSSSDGKWLFHANGVASAVYLANKEKTDYILVFSGVMADGPKREDAK